MVQGSGVYSPSTLMLGLLGPKVLASGSWALEPKGYVRFRVSLDKGSDYIKDSKP